MGREEITTIAPAIEALRAEGIDAFGPLPADTMFHASARARYDVALTMYHDQGLIPVKDARLRRGRQRHPRPAVRAHFARSRYGIRHRGPRSSQSGEPDRGAEARRPAGAMTLASDGLPPLREVVARYGLDARKALGQNFLFDLNLTPRSPARPARSQASRSSRSALAPEALPARCSPKAPRP